MSEEPNLDKFEERLGHRFADRRFLVRALTHKSFAHEAKGEARGDNETLEFLGDSVLGFVIGDLLFRRFPELDEGPLSKMKAYLVSSPILARKSREYGMGEVFYLGVGEEKSGGRKKDSLLANLFEALVAGIYLDGEIDAARAFIERSFHDDLVSIDADDLLFHDYKTALQEVAQASGHPLPEYSVVGEVGPDHDKRFVVEVKTGQDIVSRGEGTSKKEAQQQAARRALQIHRDRAPAEPPEESR